MLILINFFSLFFIKYTFIGFLSVSIYKRRASDAINPHFFTGTSIGRTTWCNTTVTTAILWSIGLYLLMKCWFDGGVKFQWFMDVTPITYRVYIERSKGETLSLFWFEVATGCLYLSCLTIALLLGVFNMMLLKSVSFSLLKVPFEFTDLPLLELSNNLLFAITFVTLGGFGLVISYFFGKDNL